MSRTHLSRSRACATFVACVAACGVAHATSDIRTIRSILTRVGSTPLTAAQVVPASGSPASGSADLSFSTSGPLALVYEITHDVAGETSAHIHNGSAGVNGAIVHTLPLGSPKIGQWNITALQLAQIASETLYLDIHSAAFPGGAIRGQIRLNDMSCFHPPVEDEPVCLRVVVQNLGPDPYVGTGPAFFANRPGDWRRALPSPNAAGRLRVTVDIDEPGKPWEKPWDSLPRTAAQFSEEFAITIMPGDSVQLDFGQIAYIPAAGGPLQLTALSEAQLPNVDPNPANDTAINTVFVQARTPAARMGTLVALALALAAIARTLLRRRAHDAS